MRLHSRGGPASLTTCFSRVSRRSSLRPSWRWLVRLMPPNATFRMTSGIVSHVIRPPGRRCLNRAVEDVPASPSLSATGPRCAPEKRELQLSRCSYCCGGTVRAPRSREPSGLASSCPRQARPEEVRNFSFAGRGERCAPPHDEGLVVNSRQRKWGAAPLRSALSRPPRSAVGPPSSLGCRPGPTPMAPRPRPP